MEGAKESKLATQKIIYASAPLLPVLAIYCLTACKNEPAKEQPANPAPATTGNNPEGVARLLFERFNQHDWEGMAALYTDTAEFKDPSFGKGMVKQTRAETVKKYKELNALFPISVIV